MMPIDFIHEEHEFTSFWQRAISEVELLRKKSKQDFLYFDPIDIQVQKFFELVKNLTDLENRSDFAVISLKPDPFRYFHFKKFPGFIHRSSNTDNDFFSIMRADPGDSPADSLASNSQQYVVLPLEGNWIAFADWYWDIGVLYGPPNIMALARRVYPFFIEPPEGFRIEPYRHGESD